MGAIMIDAKLVTFLKLYELMNYRKTAEELNLTQPAVTSQIKLLERDYGCKLFVYNKRVLSRTPEAEVLRSYAENLLYEEDNLRLKLHHKKGCNIKMGATKTIGEFVISKQVAKYTMEKDNTLSVFIDNTENLLKQIDNGTIDFALIEGNFDRNKYGYSILRNEPFVGICSKNHPFAGKQIPIADILDQHLIIREEGSGTRQIFEDIISGQNHVIEDFTKVSTISNFGLMMDVLKAVNGITFAYKAVLNKHEELTEFGLKNIKLVHEFNYVFLNNQFARDKMTLFDSYRN